MERKEITQETLFEICAGEPEVSTIAGKIVSIKQIKEEEVYALALPSQIIPLPSRVYLTLKSLLFYKLIEIGDQVLLSLPNEKPIKGTIALMRQEPQIKSQDRWFRSFGEFLRKLKIKLQSPYQHFSIGTKTWDQIEQNFQMLLKQRLKRLNSVIFASGLVLMTVRIAATCRILHKRVEEARQLRLSGQPVPQLVAESQKDGPNLESLEDLLRNEVDEFELTPKRHKPNKVVMDNIVHSESIVPTVRVLHWWDKGIPLSKEIAHYYQDNPDEELSLEETEEIEMKVTMSGFE